MYAARSTTRAHPVPNQNKYRCKVCFDFGKSEKEYNSHSTKNARGEVTCPCLLKTECKYCFKKGHMAKYCVKREQDEKKGAAKLLMPIATKIQPNHVKKVEPNFANKNAYNLLMEDEDENEDEEIATSDVKIEVPPLTPPAPENTPPPMSRFRKCVIDEKTGKRVVYMLSWSSTAYESDSECEDFEDEKMWVRIDF